MKKNGMINGGVPCGTLLSFTADNDQTSLEYYKLELAKLQMAYNSQWHEMGKLVGEKGELQLKLDQKENAEVSMSTYLNHCLAEECGEVIQVLGKIGRFGLYDTGPKKEENNLVELSKEIHDIIAVYEMFCAEQGEVAYIDRDMIISKKVRVKKYIKYSKKQGILSDE